MNKYLIFLSLSLALLTGASVQAANMADAERNITQAVKRILPDETITRISTTPIENLYEVVLGPNVIYMSDDGRYVLKGDLLDMQERANLSENERVAARKEIFSQLSTDEYIEFSPKNPKHTLYVFTDVDCAYCRRLHKDVPYLNENQIAIRYLAYPRGGLGSAAFEKMQAVWCSKDRKQALTEAKSGQVIQGKKCKNYVASDYELGQRLGIRGTPAIYTDQGKELSGYLPPDELLKIVNK